MNQTAPSPRPGNGPDRTVTVQLTLSVKPTAPDTTDEQIQNAVAFELARLLAPAYLGPGAWLYDRDGDPHCEVIEQHTQVAVETTTERSVTA